MIRTTRGQASVRRQAVPGIRGKGLAATPSTDLVLATHSLTLPRPSSKDDLTSGRCGCPSALIDLIREEGRFGRRPRVLTDERG
jgi:hypothetical protein